MHSSNIRRHRSRCSASVRQATPIAPKSNGAMETTAATAGSAAAVCSAVKPPRLCPATATRPGSSRCRDAKPGSRTAATTVAASASTFAHE